MRKIRNDKSKKNTLNILRNIPRLNRNAAAVIVIAIIVVAAVILVKTGVINIGSKSSVVTYASDSKTGYRSYNDGYIQYTKDGAKFLTKSGSESWDDAYTMISPIIDEKGIYTAIFETGGRAVRVYNGQGLIYNVQTSDPILSVAVGENGYIGVIANGDTYSVSVYSTSGNMIFQRIEAETGVYPFSCDISPDGEIIAISYMDTTGVEIDSKVGLFYIDAEKGAEYTDSMYAAVEKNDEVILGVYFMSNSGLIAIGDRNIIYIASSGTEDWNVEVTNEIMGIGMCENKLAMLYGDELPDKDGVECGTVVFISSGGKMTKGYCTGAESDFFASSEGGVVIGNGSNYYGINTNGKVVWSLNDTGNLNGIYPTSNVKKCIYTTKTWSVEADMTNFDSSNYNTDIISSKNTDTSAGTEPADSAQDNKQDNTATGGEKLKS
ncbi:MAG: DUF5711 family protein [Candidatus Metalachnospira sp.]|nr:DUF5711 family protein [Candidatus Metalachnospira sp.]